MLRFRFRTVLVLAPLLVSIWIVYRVFYFTNLHLIATHKHFNSTYRTMVLKHPTAGKPNWLPPNVLDRTYDDDFHEFLEPAKKTTATKPLKKLWFMRNGNLRPEQLKVDGTESQRELWVGQNTGDRIVEQLMYTPENYSSEWSAPSPLAKFTLYDSRKSNLKKILLIGDFAGNKIPPGRSIFWQDKCPVNTCTFVSSLEEVRHTDAVIFKNYYLKGIDTLIRRRSHHVWILYLTEPPSNGVDFGNLKHVINWTASYRHDSDIVTPFGKFVPYQTTWLYATGKVKVTKETKLKNFAAKKSKKVVWLSGDKNCVLNDGLQYATNLSQFIEVDIYGSCGATRNKKCSGAMHKKCLKMLDDDYKFYLSFENCNCKEYITETFFERGLGHNILPIVMGPGREDYARIAPPHSFIHVNDYATPRELANYLHVLDANDTLYNEYFDWKATGELINTYFWCRLCALLHAPHEPKSYENIQRWWSRPGICEA